MGVLLAGVLERLKIDKIRKLDPSEGERPCTPDEKVKEFVTYYNDLYATESPKLQDIKKFFIFNASINNRPSNNS